MRRLALYIFFGNAKIPENIKKIGKVEYSIIIIKMNRSFRMNFNFEANNTTIKIFKHVLGFHKAKYCE